MQIPCNPKALWRWTKGKGSRTETLEAVSLMSAHRRLKCDGRVVHSAQEHNVLKAAASVSRLLYLEVPQPAHNLRSPWKRWGKHWVFLPCPGWVDRAHRVSIIVVEERNVKI